MDITSIKQEGFYLNKSEGKIKNLAFISLRTSLKSYFSTYRSVAYSFDKIATQQGIQDESKNPYTTAYVENACEAIVHFHHFTELIIKDILFREHPLLAIDANDKPDIYFDLINGNQLDDSQWDALKQLEFGKALDRIVSLIKSGRLNNKYEFIKGANSWLKELNSLRNRITHRGVFVLENKSLDYLFGRYCFPLLQKIISLQDYGSILIWKYKKIQIEVDIILEIISSIQTKTYQVYKIALLKELGRAAYFNPRSSMSKSIPFFDMEVEKRSELTAKHVAEYETTGDVKTCPVCGTNALVVNSSVDDYKDYETGEYTYAYRYIHDVECFCCSFEIDREVKDMDKMGLPIENYWNFENLL